MVDFNEVFQSKKCLAEVTNLILLKTAIKSIQKKTIKNIKGNTVDFNDQIAIRFKKREKLFSSFFSLPQYIRHKKSAKEFEVLMD